MTQADTSFGDGRQVRVGHMEVDRLLDVLNPHEDVAVLLDDRDLVGDAGFKETVGKLVGLEVGAFEP